MGVVDKLVSPSTLLVGGIAVQRVCGGGGGGLVVVVVVVAVVAVVVVMVVVVVGVRCGGVEVTA